MHNAILEHRWMVRILLIAAWVMGLAFFPAASVHAAACVVTNALDSGAGSLREKVGDTSCTTITFDNDYTINLSTQLTPAAAMTIDGTGRKVTISGQNATRVFWISTTVTLNHLTITQGRIGFGAGGGAAIHNSGTLTVLNSTITDSQSPIYGRGGGIYNDTNAYLTVTNSTFARNSAYYDGGAIYNITNSHLTLTNSTLVGNSAGGRGGGVFFEYYAYFSYTNTLIANNSGGDCRVDTAWKTFSSTRNLVSDGDCSPALSGDPVLGPLAENGGQVQTFALWPGSPAIDAGTNSGCPPTDQRGQARPVNTTCDIGAYERSDTNAPEVIAFNAPASSNILTIPITTFTATDNTVIGGYLVTQSTSVPLNTDAGWSATPPATVTVSSSGDVTLYPWVMDKAGNVSALYGSPVTVRVDITPPETSILSQTPDATYTAGTSMSITFSGSDNFSVASFTCRLDSGVFGACTSPWSTSNLTNGSHAFQVAAIDWLGTQDPSPASYTWEVDITPPSMAIASSVSDPTNDASIPVQVTFSENVVGFSIDDITVENGTAGNFAGSGANYSVDITPSADGLVTLTIAAGVAQDVVGNASTAATPFTITSDRTAPTVTIDQAAGQADPSGDSPILFTATFSEPVTGFTDEDVTLTGLASATTATVTPISTTVYQVAASGITHYGTVSASIAAGGAQDLAGNDNLASTSSDPSVTFLAPSTVTISSATPTDSVVGQAFDARYAVAAKAPFTGSPDGIVTVTDGVDSCTGTAADGACSLTLTTPGVRTLTATYHGDANFTASTSEGYLSTVNHAPVITSGTSAAFSVGTPGSFTITLSGYPHPDLSLSGSQALPDGLSLVAQGEDDPQISGTPAIGAGGIYLIDLVAHNGIGAEAGQTLTLTVREDPAITSANGFNFAVGVSGQFVVHTYGYPRPALAISGELPIGIAFHDTGDGSASFTGTPAVGTDGEYPLTLQADNGSGKPASQSFTLVVGKTLPALQVAPSVSSSVFGQEMTFSAIPAASLTLPTGLVTFVLDGVPSGDAQPLVDGVATLRTHTLAVGPHTIGAAYSGDGYYRSSRAAAAQPFVVAPASTALSLAVRRGATAELTVTVAPVAPGAGTPSGPVSIYEGNQLIGSRPLDGSGKVAIAAPANLSGRHTFSVVYAGDGNFAASQAAFDVQLSTLVYIPVVCNGG
jgi:hypothetical protein